MYKVLKVRCEKRQLDSVIDHYAVDGWKVVSIKRGFWDAFFSFYKWTIILRKTDGSEGIKKVQTSDGEEIIELH